MNILGPYPDYERNLEEEGSYGREGVRAGQGQEQAAADRVRRESGAREGEGAGYLEGALLFLSLFLCCY
jgi:hypothetical protein